MKITDLTNYTTPSSTDVLPIVDVSGNTNKKVTVANLIQPDTITPAKWTNSYTFSVYNSSTTALTDNTAIKILFQTEVYDHNNNFASSTYTAPVAGVYHFDACVSHATASATVVTGYTMLYKNGSELKRGPTYPGSTTAVNSWPISVDVLLAANDTIEIYHLQDSAGGETTGTGANLTYFMGHLVNQI